MQSAQCAITVLTSGNNHTEPVKIKDFRKGHFFDSHLRIDTVARFFASQNTSLDIGSHKHVLGVFENFFKGGFTVLACSDEFFIKNGVTTWMIIFQAKFLQFSETVVDAQVVRHWNVDVQCFFGNATTLFRAHHTECAHIVQAVSKLDEYDADVFTHRKKHLFKAFGLSDFVRGKFKLV